jgi:hypothetical protein
MADTVHSNKSPATIIKGTPITVTTLPASTYTPGYVVYLTGTAASTGLDTDTAICKLMKGYILEYKPRMTSGARKDCDDAYATTDLVPTIIGGLNGPLRLVCKIADPTATLYPGHGMMANATIGTYAKSAGTGTSDTIDIPCYLAEATATGDTVAVVWYY